MTLTLTLCSIHFHLSEFRWGSSTGLWPWSGPLALPTGNWGVWLLHVRNQFFKHLPCTNPCWQSGRGPFLQAIQGVWRSLALLAGRACSITPMLPPLALDPKHISLSPIYSSRPHLGTDYPLLFLS